jgi:hypothetical protein
VCSTLSSRLQTRLTADADAQQVVWQHFRDVGARAMPTDQVAFGGQLLVRVQDGLAGHAQRGREPPAGGQARTCLEAAGEDGVTQLSVELLAVGTPRSRIELDQNIECRRHDSTKVAYHIWC